MNIRAFKYLSPLIIYLGAFWSFSTTGWQVWLPIVWAWIIIPLAELLIKPVPSNMSAAEEELAKKERTYDFLLYFIVILQYSLLIKFLLAMSLDEMTGADIAGRIWVMGLLCGTFGINVGHELGHRVNTFEQVLAKALLLTSLYMHFFTEHNKGHHKRVATPEDPSSARYGEPVYTFYFRTIFFSYISAWHIANDEVRKKGKPVFSLYNEMVQYSLIQLAFIAFIFFLFSGLVLLYFLAAAMIGILLLETVNYIEHYGLQRKPTGDGRYERAMPEHSWNSDHVIGRLMLFELSRHSDHHYLASRKYQVLRHHDASPQMPTGYPGMMILSLFPPAWFYVMNRRIKKLQSVKTV
ncbi:MAG: alkane 1-monooxygenase [Chitinophagaceae bacterium]|nr:alkane 1-monooxygenase [Chitinophagaceae bacterium]MBP6232066.1 alkane 1-monooxygenase [Chitinophagaceae bacterium]MBP6417215.1 alkane 1-monooxygenase [Chitinophagaceae bacterium]